MAIAALKLLNHVSIYFFFLASLPHDSSSAARFLHFENASASGDLSMLAFFRAALNRLLMGYDQNQPYDIDPFPFAL